MPNMSREIPVFYSYSIVDKFRFPNGKRPNMDKPVYDELLDAGLQTLIDEGVAFVAGDINQGTHKVVIFPKYAPSRPYEAMMSLIPMTSDSPVINKISELELSDLKTFFNFAQILHGSVVNTCRADGHNLDKSYMFQHFGPHDINPKTSYNTSFLPFHLHIQAYGHSLAEFPDAFTPNGRLGDFEGYEYLDRDPNVFIFVDSMRSAFPDIDFTQTQKNVITICEKPVTLPISDDELQQMKEITQVWLEIWDEFANCFVDLEALRLEQSQIKLLPVAEREERLKILTDTYTLSTTSLRLLNLYKENIIVEHPETWKNMYHGANGSIGIEFDWEKGIRKWAIVPRLLRSWSRHFPLVKPTEMTVKDEQIKGINPEAAATLLPIQRRILKEYARFSWAFLAP
jgi:hypothetical protein